MPDFACQIRIRPKYRAHGRMHEEWRTVLASGPDAAMAQVYAVGEVSRANPGCSVSAHGADIVASDAGVIAAAHAEPAEAPRKPARPGKWKTVAA